MVPGLLRSIDMRLTSKIIALFLLAASGLVAASGWFSMQREVAFFHEEMAERHQQLAIALRPRVQQMLNMSPSMQFLVELSRNDRQVQARWVWLSETQNSPFKPLSDAGILQAASPGEMVSLPVKSDSGEELYCSYYLMPTGIDGPNGAGALELCERFARRDAYTQDTFLRTLLLLVGLGVVAVLMVSLVGVRLVGRPLEALLHKADAATNGDLLTPVHVHGNDELADLARALNRMCSFYHSSQQALIAESEKRMQAVEQLRHADRLKTVGRLGAGIAHELGTPLNVVSGRAALIAEGKLSEEDIKSSAEAIRHEARRMTRLIDGLLNFSRRVPARRSRCDVADVVRTTVPLLESFARKRNASITVDIQCQHCDACQADYAQLQQVVSNLILNALGSKTEAAHVVVRVLECRAVNPQAPAVGERPCLAIAVQDDGDGIPEKNLPHLFEPFFTTREPGEGTGLGLSIVHGIVSEHDGWITVESREGHGSCFTVYLPQDTATASQTDSANDSHELAPSASSSRPTPTATTSAVGASGRLSSRVSSEPEQES